MPYFEPVVLFFVLGIIAGVVRSDLKIHSVFYDALSIFLLLAIGLKGGVELARYPLLDLVLPTLAVVTVGSLIPLLAFPVLRRIGKLPAADAGSIAAHYGSVSVVTFVTASEILKAVGMAPAGYMVAVLAVMETPAILSGLYLAQRGTSEASGKASGDAGGNLWHEVLLNASVVLLLGSFAIGWIAGPAKFEEVKLLFDGLFKGVLCLFLLDMGLIAARRLLQSRAINLRLVMLAVLFPLVNGMLGTLAGHAIGLDAGSVAAFGVLCASASYIAVPAAMRVALPQADPGIYLTMSLSLSFPFNLIINIGLIAWAARALAGG